MSRNIWRGAISFGLINIPVTVETAVMDHDLTFHLLDKRNLSRVKFTRTNEKNGNIVPNDQIVKGYEFKKGKYVVMNAQDFKDANPKASQMIEIDAFVDRDEIDPMYFEKPYYLIPEKTALKSYFLLQEAMSRSKKVAIAKFVMHEKEHLTCVIPHGKMLVLELMRFAHNLKTVPRIASVKSKPQELQMAQRLIEDMTGKWDPARYKDTYYGDLMKQIHRRIAAGKIKRIEKQQEKRMPPPGKTTQRDLMSLLKASLHQ